jgi:hypothetical protein
MNHVVKCSKASMYCDTSAACRISRLNTRPTHDDTKFSTRTHAHDTHTHTPDTHTHTHLHAITRTQRLLLMYLQLKKQSEQIAVQARR